MSAIERELATARQGLERVDPEQAAALHARGGLLVDIRPAAQRAEFGGIPEAVVIERNVLEWRLDPTSPDKLPIAPTPDQPVVVICQEGYASSLAAASLQALGLRGATDLDGGFAAWKAAGLSVTEPEDSAGLIGGHTGPPTDPTRQLIGLSLLGVRPLIERRPADTPARPDDTGPGGVPSTRTGPRPSASSGRPSPALPSASR